MDPLSLIILGFGGIGDERERMIRRRDSSDNLFETLSSWGCYQILSSYPFFPLSHFLNPSTRNTKAGSCGRCVPSTWSKVIDTTTGETVGANCRGELLVKGPQVG
jgi:hypothetical protein